MKYIYGCPHSVVAVWRGHCYPKFSHFIPHSLSVRATQVSLWEQNLNGTLPRSLRWCIPYHVTVYPKKYAHGFVVLCFVVVMQSFIMNSHEVFIHIHQGCFAGTGAIVRLPQCQWRKPDGYWKISQCITTTKHSKAKTVCIFLGIYCILNRDKRDHNVFINRTALSMLSARYQ